MHRPDTDTRDHELSRLRVENARLRQERDEYLDQLLRAYANRPPEPEERTAA